MPTIETYRNKLLKLWKKNPENREIENWLTEYDREMEKEELDMKKNLMNLKNQLNWNQLNNI